jgi:hypothetical protein
VATDVLLPVLHHHSNTTVGRLQGLRHQALATVNILRSKATVHLLLGLRQAITTKALPLPALGQEAINKEATSKEAISKVATNLHTDVHPRVLRRSTSMRTDIQCNVLATLPMLGVAHLRHKELSNLAMELPVATRFNTPIVLVNERLC